MKTADCKKTLYLECYSGISGDMAVGAMLDLGADRDVLETVLKNLNVDGFRTEIKSVSKSGIVACDFDVILDEDNHDHDNEYLYGDKVPEAKHHHHRHLNDIISIIENSKMTDSAKALAVKIFRILADSESKVHGVEPEKVHFHEVGAVDSIVDIVSFAVCFDNLGFTDVIVPSLNEGTGSIRCQHGVIPVPVPAVSNIVSDYKIAMKIMNVSGEYVTPTGAAIVAAIRTSDKLPESMTIEKIGVGAGKRITERSGIVRAMIISESDNSTHTIWKLECNIDDCSGEAFGFTLDKLMSSGAKDANYMPVFMKKNRPAYLLTVICAESDIEKMENIIFEETTTIGIRRVMMKSTVLERSVVTVKTSLGAVRVKICDCVSNVRYYPEYDDVVKACKEHDLPYQTAYQIIQMDCIRYFEETKKK